jgi:hypothetical protein
MEAKMKRSLSMSSILCGVLACAGCSPVDGPPEDQSADAVKLPGDAKVVPLGSITPWDWANADSTTVDQDGVLEGHVRQANFTAKFDTNTNQLTLRQDAGYTQVSYNSHYSPAVMAIGLGAPGWTQPRTTLAMALFYRIRRTDAPNVGGTFQDYQRVKCASSTGSTLDRLRIFSVGKYGIDYKGNELSGDDYLYHLSFSDSMKANGATVCGIPLDHAFFQGDTSLDLVTVVLPESKFWGSLDDTYSGSITLGTGVNPYSTGDEIAIGLGHFICEVFTLGSDGCTTP